MERIPEDILKIINRINEKGYEAYIVGGSVRDMLLGRVPSDWDIATNAKPKDIKSIFSKTIDTGIKHGTITVSMENYDVEVTTYRKESVYSDKRRPDSVEFVENIYEDLRRRDFTINSIALKPEQGFIDYNNGIEDLKAKTIRCVGNPKERFGEDALRMIRAVRFAAQLGFDLETATLQAIKENAKNITDISSERIREEFKKILISSDVKRGIYLMEGTGLLKFILPELDDCIGLEQENPHHEFDVFKHTVTAVSNIEPKLHLRLIMLLHDIGKLYTKTIDEKGLGHFYNHEEVSAQLSEQILDRLRFDRIIKRKVVNLVRWHDYRLNADEKAIRRAINKMGREEFEDYLLIRDADIKAQSMKYMKTKLENQRKIGQIYQVIVQKNEPLTLKDLNIDGCDLKNLGVSEGEKIRLTLDFLMDKVLDNPFLNEKQTLINMAKSFRDID